MEKAEVETLEVEIAGVGIRSDECTQMTFNCQAQVKVQVQVR